jgi:hypothetical protein
MDVLLTPSKQQVTGKSIYESLFINEQLSEERLRQDFGPPISSQQIEPSVFSKSVKITANVYENEDMIAYIGFLKERILFVTTLFKRYPPNLAAELIARQIKLTDQSLDEFRGRYVSSSAFARDLNKARNHSRLLQSGALNGLPRSLAEKLMKSPLDAGSSGEVVGALNVYLFGEGQAIVYYFPDSPLCDKSLPIAFPWSYSDNFRDLKCDNPSAKGHLSAISRIYREYSRLLGINPAAEPNGGHLNILGEAAAAAGFYDRRALVQQPQ